MSKSCFNDFPETSFILEKESNKYIYSYKIVHLIYSKDKHTFQNSFCTDI